MNESLHIELTIARALAASGLPRLDARLLLEYATGFDAVKILAHPEHALSSEQAAHYRALCERRRVGEPIAYLAGRREFYGLSFEVSPCVLIPRPETELLVDMAEQAIANGARAVLDLGTGSGAIAIALARRCPEAAVVATDASAVALALAERNATRLGARVRFAMGDWFDAVAGSRFDVIVTNPPYVAANDAHLHVGDVRFEPRTALIGGADGLDAIRHIVARAPAHLASRAPLWIEHGHDQAAAVRELLERAGLQSVRTELDLAGIPRVTGGTMR